MLVGFLTGLVLLAPRVLLFFPFYPLIFAPYRVAFVAFFGLHFAGRFTLMDPARRKQAITVFAVTAPILYFGVPIQYTAIVLLRPRWMFRAIDSWITYPPVISPGHWRAPIDSPIVRVMFSLCLIDWPQALLCILPLTFIVKEDEPPTFQRLFRALQNSPYPREREMALLGLHADDGAPIMFHWTKFKRHVLMLGTTGGGKTSAMMLLLHQLMIILPKAYFGFVDGKAYSLEVIAEMFASGKEVKWFTIENGKSTYKFNPLNQTWYKRIPRAFQADFWTAGLNADSGNDYGHFFYTIGAMVNLLRPLRRNPQEIEELRRNIEQEKNNKRLRKELMGAGALMQGIMEILSAVEPLKGDSTIQLSDDIDKGRCIFFAFPAHMVPVTARMLGGITIQAHIRAVADLEPGTFKGFLIIDELPRFAGRNVEMFLQLARSHGLSVIMGLPSATDAKGQVSDVGTAAMNLADFQWVFTAWDQREQKRVKDMSGETIEWVTTYKPSFELIPRWTVGRRNGQPVRRRTSPERRHIGFEPTLTESVESRLNLNEINQISAEPQVSIIQPKDADYQGATNTIRHFYHIDEATFLKRERMPWPAGNADTITPNDVNEDLFPPEPPKPDKPDDDPPFTPHRTKKPRK